MANGSGRVLGTPVNFCIPSMRKGRDGEKNWKKWPLTSLPVDHQNVHRLERRPLMPKVMLSFDLKAVISRIFKLNIESKKFFYKSGSVWYAF